MARYRSRPLTHPNETGNYCYQDAGTDSCRPIWLVVLHLLSRHVTFRSLTSTHVTSVTSPHTTWLHPGIYCLLFHRPKWTSAPHQTHHQTDPDWTTDWTTAHGVPSSGHLAGAPRRGTPAANHRAGSAGPARARPRPRLHAVALAGRAATWPGRRPSLRRIAAVGGNRTVNS